MITTPISVGELLDKLSILSIKKNRLTNPDKLFQVEKEFSYLYELSEPFLGVKDYFNLYDDLVLVNSKLWDIEDKIRVCEKNKKFDEEYIFKTFIEPLGQIGKEKTPEEKAKSEEEKQQIYSDIKKAIDNQPEFDTLEQSQQKITNFINK